MNRKGFTLVEVLAVVILLGIIGTIIVINYNRYLEASRESAFKDSMVSLISQLEEYTLDNRNLKIPTTKETAIEIPFNKLNLENKDKLTGSFYLKDNFIILVNVSDGDYCANGNKNDLTKPGYIDEGTCDSEE